MTGRASQIDQLLWMSGFWLFCWVSKSQLYFYRDSNGNEADILFQHGRELTAIEIKSSSTYKAALLKGLNKIAALSPAIKSACLVYAGDDMIFTDGTQAVNFSNVNRIFSV